MTQIEDRTEDLQAPEAPTTAPMTGDEYIDSLKDDREIWIYGERVKDVTKHPGFRNTARMVARLYDALHDPKRKDKLLVPTDTGNGGMTHAFFKAPQTPEELLAGRTATLPMVSGRAAKASGLARLVMTPPDP